MKFLSINDLYQQLGQFLPNDICTLIGNRITVIMKGIFTIGYGTVRNWYKVRYKNEAKLDKEVDFYSGVKVVDFFKDRLNQFKDLQTIQQSLEEVFVIFNITPGIEYDYYGVQLSFNFYQREICLRLSCQDIFSTFNYKPSRIAKQITSPRSWLDVVNNEIARIISQDIRATRYCLTREYISFSREETGIIDQVCRIINQQTRLFTEELTLIGQK